MEQFIPDGSKPQEVCIGNLKMNNIVIFLISPYYGSLMDTCSLKEECKAKCLMKTKTGKISYTHCEYKTTIAEGILHQTYLVGKGWDAPNVKKEALQFKEEIGDEYLGFIDIDDPDLVQHICNNLAAKIVEWHTQDKLDFTQFCDREDKLNELMENIDSKVEVWGVGGVGKTALIELALLIQKLKGKRILTIGTSKAYASGSGFEDFRIKCKDDQYIAESRNRITIHDLVNAFTQNGLLPNAEEVNELPKDKKIEVLLQKFRDERNLILFIDDFHLATEGVVDMAKSMDHIILSSRKSTYIARKEIYLSGIDEEDREKLVKLFSTEIPTNVMNLINKIAEGHPVSTELLVRNYNKINFNKFKEFELSNVDSEHVEEFYKRVIQEILSEKAFSLLKDLSVLNNDLETNIEKERVENSYSINIKKNYFNELVDTGMLKKKEGKEGIYEFSFKHIQDALENIASKKSHKKAIKYYKKTRKIMDVQFSSGRKNLNEEIEILSHMVKLNSIKHIIGYFNVADIMCNPFDYGFKRLIDVGEELRAMGKNQITLQNKVHICVILGNKYITLRRFEEAESVLIEALEIHRELTDKYGNLELIASIKNSLGILYRSLGRLKEAEVALQETLEIRLKLVEMNPNEDKRSVVLVQNDLGKLYSDLGKFTKAEHMYLEALDSIPYYRGPSEILRTLEIVLVESNLGDLYIKLKRYEEAEVVYQEALELRRKVASLRLFPHSHNYDVGKLQNSLGSLYLDSNRLEKAETAFQEALDLRKELAAKSPEIYGPDLANTLINIGILCMKLNRFEEAEEMMDQALDHYSQLYEKRPDVYRLDVSMTWYNKACLESKRNDKEKSVEFLKKAIELNKKYGDNAKTDEVFDNIRNSKEFKELIEK